MYTHLSEYLNCITYVIRFNCIISLIQLNVKRFWKILYLICVLFNNAAKRADLGSALLIYCEISPSTVARVSIS